MIFIVCCNFINSFFSFLLILFLFPFCYLINGAFLIAHLLFCILCLMLNRTNAWFMNVSTRNSMGRGSVNIKPSFIISQCEVTNGDYVNKRRREILFMLYSFRINLNM